MRFDRSQPYATISGMPGVAYAQNGHYFNGGGHVVRNPEEEMPEAAEEAPPASLSGGMRQSVHLMDEETVPHPEPVTPAKSDDMRLKENKALKLQMENFGEPWQGVDHARRFLGIA